MLFIIYDKVFLNNPSNNIEDVASDFYLNIGQVELDDIESTEYNNTVESVRGGVVASVTAKLKSEIERDELETLLAFIDMTNNGYIFAPTQQQYHTALKHPAKVAIDCGLIKRVGTFVERY